MIFLLAIIHTFLAPKILGLSHRIQHAHEAQLGEIHGPDFKEKIPRRMRQSIPAAVLHFLGEVEAVFGIWVIPLALLMWVYKGAGVRAHYLDQDVPYIEPLFVVVIMAIAASRPILQFAVRVLGLIAGQSPARWWLALLTLGPLLGSFITEPAAMTICALLLGREFYRLGPSPRFMYATLGLLFVNVSVGGALTNFAAPPVLIVAAKWGWSTLYMAQQFGFRALAGIFVGNGIYFLIFGKEFARLAGQRRDLPPDESARARNRCRSGSPPCISRFSAGPSSSRTSRRSSSAAFFSSSPSPWRPRPTRMKSTCARRCSSAFSSRGWWCMADCRAGGSSRC